MAYNLKEKDKIMNDIFKVIESGASLRTAIKQLKTIDVTTFYVWLNSESEESKRYARTYASSCEQRAETMFEEIIDIADNVGCDMIQNSDGVLVVNHAVIQRDRLRVDARKWNLSKMLPKKYGDRQIIDATIEQIKPLKLVRPDIAKDLKKDLK